MTVHLHHVFCFTPPEPPAIPGLVESFRRAHPGQGTANRCHVFGDAYLELLWETDRGEITAPALARTGLAERARWRDNGACPFGLCVTPATTDGPPPFPTWDYAPPFLPQGMAIPAATLSDDVTQPFVFLPPVIGQPQEVWQPGLGRIAGLTIEHPAQVTPAPALAALTHSMALSPTLTLVPAQAWRLVLSVETTEGTASGRRRLALPEGCWLD